MSSLNTNSSQHRANALWGSSSAAFETGNVAGTLAMLAAATAAAAAPSGGRATGAFIQSSLQSAIQQNPSQKFDVILEGQRRDNTAGFVKKALAGYALRRKFRSLNGVQLTLTGKQIQLLAKLSDVAAILPNEPVKSSSIELPHSNAQR